MESRGGDQRQIPIVLGMTKSTQPDTPDLAGSPTYKDQEVRIAGSVVVVVVVVSVTLCG